jgi:hypothetical protein
MADITSKFEQIDPDRADPQPCEVRRAKPHVRDEFYMLAKKVRAAVALRTLVGEFNDVQHAPLDDGEALQCMRLIAAKSEGLFTEYVPYDEIAPLFAQRKHLAFGQRVIEWDEDRVISPQTRLNSSINAAKRAWESQHSTDELYEVVTRSYA